MFINYITNIEIISLYFPPYSWWDMEKKIRVIFVYCHENREFNMKYDDM